MSISPSSRALFSVSHARFGHGDLNTLVFLLKLRQKARQAQVTDSGHDPNSNRNLIEKPEVIGKGSRHLSLVENML